MAGTKITEKLEFLTDIITSYDGKEQRMKLRQQPRKFYSYDYDAMKDGEAQWLRTVPRIRQSDTYYVPMWHQEARLSSDCLNVNSRMLEIDENYMYHFEGVEWIEIFKRDDPDQSGFLSESGVLTSNLVFQVREYSTGIIRLHKKVGEKLLKANTWIYPLRKCSLQPISQLNYVFSKGANVTLNFEDILYDSFLEIPSKYKEYDYDIDQFNRFHLPTGAPPEIAYKEVFLFSPHWEDDSDYYFKVEKNTEKLDNSTGVFLYDIKNTMSYDIHTLPLILRNVKMIDNLKRFFINHAGRYKSFWAPTWTNDFEICRDIKQGTNYFLTTFTSYYKYWTTNKRRKAVCVFTKSWKSYFGVIENYVYVIEDGVKMGKIIFNGTSDITIPVRDIWMTSYVNLVRFDSDELILNYETTEVAHTDIVLREVDE